MVWCVLFGVGWLVVRSFSLDLGPGGIQFGGEEVEVVKCDTGAMVGVVWWCWMVGSGSLVILHGVEAGGVWVVKAGGVLAEGFGWFFIFC